MVKRRESKEGTKRSTCTPLRAHLLRAADFSAGRCSRSERLTGRRKAILEFIVEHIQESGYPPTVREICEGLGLTNWSLQYHLGMLEDYGYILRDPGVARGIRLLKLPPEES